MIDQEMLVYTLLTMQGTLFAALAVLLVNAVFLWYRKRHYQALLIQGQAELVLATDADAASTSCPPAIQKLPMVLKLQLFTRLVPNLKGARRKRLQQLALAAGLTRWAEDRCRSAFWWKRLHGIRILTEIGGAEEIAASFLHDPNNLVRAQAIEWAADHPSPEIVSALLEHLADPDPFCRHIAMDSLIRVGAVVVPFLAEYLAHRSGRAVGLEAGLRVALALADGRLLEPALQLCRYDIKRVRALSARLVGAIGGSLGLDTIQAMLSDPDAEVRAAASEAVGRLGHWPAVSSLAGLLEDPSWDVRRAAGLALRDLGSPGILFLRRALSSSDPMAADMARQVLDIQEALPPKEEPVPGT